MKIEAMLTPVRGFVWTAFHYQPEWHRYHIASLVFYWGKKMRGWSYAIDLSFGPEHFFVFTRMVDEKREMWQFRTPIVKSQL